MSKEKSNHHELKFGFSDRLAFGKLTNLIYWCVH